MENKTIKFKDIQKEDNYLQMCLKERNIRFFFEGDYLDYLTMLKIYNKRLVIPNNSEMNYPFEEEEVKKLTDICLKERNPFYIKVKSHKEMFLLQWLLIGQCKCVHNNVFNKYNAIEGIDFQYLYVNKKLLRISNKDEHVKGFHEEFVLSDTLRNKNNYFF